ncbi:MAG: type II toxin-antitoxin system HipA family toxin [Betaproteobacteria bacterium]
MSVWINGEHAADWRVPSRGEVELQYTEAWVAAPHGRPLSLSLPLTLDNAPIRGDKVRYYFDNLLPDSESIRQRIQSRYKTQSRDPFALLAAVGRDCVGAVQLLPAGIRPADFDRIQAVPLSDGEVEKALNQMMASVPAQLEEEELRISIAGAQEKSAFLLHEGSWCRPIGATPTTHIFKLPLGLVGGVQADMRGSVENEWLCAQVLRHFGLPVAKCEMRQFGSLRPLIVERFDRQLHSSGTHWLRLVQEDFCQVFAVPHSRKYEADGGPGIFEIANVLKNSANRDADLEVFLKAQLVFWMLAAADGHAKNFSLRILPQGRYHLTPLYDVLSYWPIVGHDPNKYPVQKLRLAMAMRGKNKHYSLTEIRRRHFTETAARSGIGRKGAERLIEEVSKQAAAVVAAVQGAVPRDFPAQVLDPILTGLLQQAKRL